MANEETSDEGQGVGGKKSAVDTLDPHPEDHHMIPVWFFVGLLLFIYGILITLQGLVEYSNPPVANYHAPIWWGIVMIIIGGIFFQRFYPRKK
jgi:FtsH-binding integral membrane protein